MNSADHFEAIVNEHYEALHRFALSLTHAESDALDLTQHTFHIWATKGHHLRDHSKVKSWLYTTLHRAFLQAGKVGKVERWERCQPIVWFIVQPIMLPE